MTGPPGITSADFSRPKLRQCPFDLSTLTFIKTVGFGHDGYCWLVRFGDKGPFVLKVFRHRDTSERYCPPRMEARNVALFQMIEESVKQSQIDGKPPLVVKEPKMWVDAMDSIKNCSTEMRCDPEGTRTWAAENGLELAPLLSVPRLRKCYGWVPVGSQLLHALPRGVRPHTVVVSHKDQWSFTVGTDDDGDDLLYYSYVYEYIEPGDNDAAEVQKVLDFLQQVCFTHCGSPCGHNWQSNILLDYADVTSPTSVSGTLLDCVVD